MGEVLERGRLETTETCEAGSASREHRMWRLSAAPHRTGAVERAQLRDTEREVRFGQVRGLSENLVNLLFRRGHERKRSHGGNCKRKLIGCSRSVEARKVEKRAAESCQRVGSVRQLRLGNVMRNGEYQTSHVGLKGCGGARVAPVLGQENPGAGTSKGFDQ